ncbi:MAG: NAD(P)H-dependent oxidoreductase subunit E [Clostridia bacterium]|nr:NAD(P)H-dependent oxidoreductase subunit E [Clostridia bacterium]
MKVTICIGSSCHLKGSKQIIEKLQALVAENNLKDKVDLAGKFCMGNCAEGVCVSIGEQVFSVQPDTVQTFFNDEILAKA